MISSAEEFVFLLENEPREAHRRAVHDEAPSSVWLDVLQRYPEHRAAVAWNKTIPEVVLGILARDADWRIRCDIASKRAASPSLLEQLARDESANVRASVARNPRAEGALVRALLTDMDEDVRNAARRRLGLNTLSEELPTDIEES